MTIANPFGTGDSELERQRARCGCPNPRANWASVMIPGSTVFPPPLWVATSFARA